eukprot:TRINITY_DN4900_c0_g1_i2.p1 TRINITY_DN4900_c0_g1~~TRINITY_DN4900_c0_g1_i2.p1  ORF type:complete len:420 (-),score=86.48 TRINITY_DN4900_c0_g1_i2:216-1475(-)
MLQGLHSIENRMISKLETARRKGLKTVSTYENEATVFTNRAKTLLSSFRLGSRSNSCESLSLRTVASLQNLALADLSLGNATLRHRFVIGAPQIYHQLPKSIRNPQRESEGHGGEISSGFYPIPETGGVFQCDLATGNRGPGRMQFQSPAGVAFHYGLQTFYIADTSNSRLQRLTPDLEFPGLLVCELPDPESLLHSSTTEPGAEAGGYARRSAHQKKFRPVAVCISRDGSQVFVTDSDSKHVRVVSPEGAVLRILDAGLKEPTHMAIDMQDYLYIYDEPQGGIVKISSSGEWVWTLRVSHISTKSHIVEALCVMEDNHLLVLVRDDYQLHVVDSSGVVLGAIHMATREHGSSALARGPNGGFALASSRSVVDIYSRTGDLISSVFAPSPTGVVFDDLGALFVVCGYDHAVRRYSAVGG